MIVAFTGHRPNKIGGYGPSPAQDRVRARITAALEELRPTRAITGMALGVDQWAAEACYVLGIPYVAAVPFAGQESAWPASSQADYRDLIALADEVVTVCDGGYAAWKMQRRNEWMVDHCDLLIAVWDGTQGGTANCVKYAEKKGRWVRPIDPT